MKQNSAHGVGKLTLIVFGSLFIAFLYSVLQIIPFYYCYFEIVNQMETVIRVAGTEPDAEIRKKLMYHVKKLELPADSEDLKVEREDHFMRISLPYQEVFYITWRGKDYDLHTFKFHAYAEGEF